jgi:sphingomyelin phosphodiesterase 2
MVPQSLAHQIILAHAPVRDVWRVLHPDSSVGLPPAATPDVRRPIPAAEFNLRENGVTSNSVLNTWRWSKDQQRRLGAGKPPVPAIPPDTSDPRAKRLDYIFAGTGPWTEGGANTGVGWVVKRVAVGMTERHPELGCSLSDHFSVEATLVLPNAACPGNVKPTDSLEKSPPPKLDGHALAMDKTATGGDGDGEAMHNGAYLQSPTASDFRCSKNFDGQLAMLGTEERSLPVETYDTILSIIDDYMIRERIQRRWRGLHFFAWVAVAVACLIAVWFSPRNFVSFILMLLSTLGLVAGTLDGLMSLLFFSSEIRALKEFRWEIMNAKVAAEGGLPFDSDFQEHV